MITKGFLKTLRKLKKDFIRNLKNRFRHKHKFVPNHELNYATKVKTYKYICIVCGEKRVAKKYKLKKNIKLSI